MVAGKTARLCPLDVRAVRSGVGGGPIGLAQHSAAGVGGQLQRKLLEDDGQAISSEAGELRRNEGSERGSGNRPG